MTSKVDHAVLAEFLVVAKQHTYAARGDEDGVVPLLPGAQQFEYHDGPFLYRDIFVGMGFFAGLETVYHTEQPIWTMSYAGGVWPTNVLTEEIPAIYSFLHEALRLVEASQPFRGPGTYQQSTYLYWNESQGNLTRFTGREAIYHGSLLVYELRYHGGLVR
jgi:hypothetical protein